MFSVVFILITFVFIVQAEPIAYGQFAGSHPSSVYVKIISKEYGRGGGLRSFTSICGGVILNQGAILTAAHCLTESITEPQVNVFAGISDLKNIPSSKMGIVKSSHIHHNYDENHLDDIAVMKLFLHLPLIRGSIEIATFGRAVIGQKAISIGWGINEEGEKSQKLQQLEMKVISKKKCSPFFDENDQVICAWADNRKSTPCVGDSGSPLIQNDKVIGLTVRTLSMVAIYDKHGTHTFCHGDKPAVFVEPLKYSTWIRRQLI